jgi:SpoVK/Ycf46/Vps4 family AAA+-type ATPase
LQELSYGYGKNSTEPKHSFETLPGRKPYIIDSFIKQIKNPGDYPPAQGNGLLLHGPHGTGKTAFAHAIAHELNAPLFIVTAGLINSRGEKQTAAAMQEIFKKVIETANSHPSGKVILCFDEIDSIARSRTHSYSDHSIALVNELLTQLNDTIKNKVIVIATTNFAQHVDEAVHRSGRLQLVKVDVPKPADNATRAAIAQSYLCKILPGNDVLIETLSRTMAPMTTGLSPADIALIIDQAHRMAIEQHKAIDIDTIQRSIKIFKRNGLFGAGHSSLSSSSYDSDQSSDEDNDQADRKTAASQYSRAFPAAV